MESLSQSRFGSRLRSSSRRLLLATLCLLWGGHLWLRDERPLWTSASIAGGTCPIGFTEEGTLITSDGDQNPVLPGFPGSGVMAPSGKGDPLTLTTWNVETGEVIRRVTPDIPMQTMWGFITTKNCESILVKGIDVRQADGSGSPFSLSVKATDSWIVIDPKTGQQRCPPLHSGSSSFPNISPDGRFAVFDRLSDDGRSRLFVIFDLKTGQPLYEIPNLQSQTKEQIQKSGSFNFSTTLFTQDSREWMTIECDAHGASIVFRSTSEGAETRRYRMPDLPQFYSLMLSHWEGDHLFYRVQWFPSDEGRQFDFLGCTLADQRVIRHPEWDQFASQSNDSHGCFQYTHRGDDWAAVVRGEQDQLQPEFIRFWNAWTGRITSKLMVSHRPNPFAVVQYLNREDRSPRGVPLTVRGHDGVNFLYLVSPDGRWLADGGDRLRVYRTPPSGKGKRIPGILLIAILGFLIDRKWRRSQSQSRQTEFIPLPSSTTG